MQGINRANVIDNLSETIKRLYLEVNEREVPCIFISYQRTDEDYAKEVADYIISQQIDVYFDLNDSDLKHSSQVTDPRKVTEAIKTGLTKSSHMLVIVSPDTFRSPWVPFEVGYAYDKKGEKMKILRHKGISKVNIPDYLKVKELLQGTKSLNLFLASVKKGYIVYENIMKKGEEIKSFSEYIRNPLNKYLDNE